MITLDTKRQGAKDTFPKKVSLRNFAYRKMSFKKGEYEKDMLQKIKMCQSFEKLCCGVDKNCFCEKSVAEIHIQKV